MSRLSDLIPLPQCLPSAPRSYHGLEYLSPDLLLFAHIYTISVHHHTPHVSFFLLEWNHIINVVLRFTFST